jgi:hypothetical protein
MLKVTIDSASELRDYFIAYNRDNYSYQGYQEILDYYSELEQDIELDVIAICCDWNELDINDVIEEYSIDLTEITDDEGEIDVNEKLELVLEYLNDRTYAIDIGNSILFLVF